ncbi:preprotein translocase subunit SecA [Candidatus Beckwithbacteria bacterium CG10_big_fil_rev_8_21_14_0_10_34_10]|uniref:Protein translocase subunit SecA n=1 Tax=Candidatus Beckwithbacteria bacterium CG10_big_fil_rev_8_21_14_0_10_34_10 TaxID=1974495 RepID=A0A2H0W9D9_9BACT|nr:MAG: preprotein translocase subunit SecA [Candidatus Beckwithbacteria bacterium CG10_big_fil_rev_8_21_14_0_10_34_10]
MFKFIKKLLDLNARELKKFEFQVGEINSLEDKFEKFKDKDFSKKTSEFKKRLSAGESLADLLVEAFALAREAIRRTVGERAFDVQLMASIALHQGKVAEQRTGEGKTLSAVITAYLNTLEGKGVHIVTVNDYLARRDAGWYGVALDLLGVSVACIIHDQSYLLDLSFKDAKAQDERLIHLRQVKRKEAYSADITYGTNNEFGFDYLRDNMAQSLKDCVQRGHNFAIVDEVDSILIDEARTPLIISMPDMEPTQKYYEFSRLVEELSPDTDYLIDEKLKTANLTEHGITKVEKKLGVDNLYEKDFDTIKHIENALKAKTLFKKDREYVVKEGQVVIVDEFTGRLMHGRRWSEGLHQAVEAKENQKIQQESRTLATISFQNYFRMYKKLSGMTGTAATEAEEFKKIYDLDTLVIPTNKPVLRVDHSDVVYKTTRAKYAAVSGEIAKKYQKGQPVLVGTTSIAKNEIIHELLKRKKIPHNVLNAKQHEREALIISQAGKPQGVTVATNMAGRGVDIVLGGAYPEDRNDKKEMKKWQADHDRVIKAGGLHVIGTERHESRRIDNQLRGRSGRQGDPGSSRFYVALDDDIMRLFGGDQVAKLMTVFKMPENIPLEHGMVSRAIQQAQTKVEGFNFDARKHVVEYDDVMNKQREIIYSKRRKILEMKEESTELKEKILGKLEGEVESIVNLNQGEEGKIDSEKILTQFLLLIPFDPRSQAKIKDQVKKGSLAAKVAEFLKGVVKKTYQAREKQLGVKVMRQIERFVSLRTIDKLWVDHLDAVDDLREGIGLRGYAQRDPLVEYKKEAFSMFEKLMGDIDYEINHRVFRLQPKDQSPVVVPDLIQTNIDQSDNMGLQKEVDFRNTTPQAAAMAAVQTGQRVILRNRDPQSGKKIGRNDPCWCGAKKPDGTFKKYKHCHGQ